MAKGNRHSTPLVQIPLAPAEIQIVRDCAEPGGWGYYELKIEENDHRGVVNVVLITAKGDDPINLIWFLDRNHRSAIARGINRVFGEHLVDG